MTSTILTWLLPFAFVGVIPAAYFLDRHEAGLSTRAMLTPVVGIVVLTWLLMPLVTRGLDTWLGR